MAIGSKVEMIKGELNSSDSLLKANVVCCDILMSEVEGDAGWSVCGVVTLI